MAGQSFYQFNPQRIRSFLFRLPLCTRILLLAMVVLYVCGIFLPWLRDWGALVPSKVGLSSMYRLNTFPLVHLGLFHLIFNILALTNLLERFEAENGTLVTLLLFTGPFSTLPGALYILLDHVVFRFDTPVLGASIWTFLLLTSSFVVLSKTNPSFSVGPYAIPTQTVPLIVLVVTSVLIPGTSLLGHLCGAAVGYLWGLGYVKFLVPPEKILRWLEGKLNLLGRLPHYVSVDQKTYGRYGVLPSVGNANVTPTLAGTGVSGQRLGP